MRALLAALFLLVWIAPAADAGCHLPSPHCFDTSEMPEGSFAHGVVDKVHYQVYVAGFCATETPGAGQSGGQLFLRWAFTTSETGYEATIHPEFTLPNVIDMPPQGDWYFTSSRPLVKPTTFMDIKENSEGTHSIHFTLEVNGKTTSGVLTFSIASCNLALQDAQGTVIGEEPGFKGKLIPIGAGVVVGVAATVIIGRVRK